MNAIRTYRKAVAAERGIRYRIARGQAGTRNALGTERALANHADTRAQVVRRLVAEGRRTLVGLLVEEADLAARLRSSSEPRPELAQRLAGVRGRIRAETGDTP